MVTDHPLIDPQARVRTLCHALPGQWMTEGIGFYCGIVMRWYRDAFCELEQAEAARRGLDPYVVMEEAAASIAPGSNGLLAVFSNVMDAKRWVQASPSFLQFDVDDPARSNRKAVHPGHRGAGRLRLARAPRDHRGADRPDRRRDRHTGGAAKGSLWPQIVADVLGVTVRVPVVKESTALGAALCAGVGAGIYTDLAQTATRLVRWERSFEPEPAARAIYDVSYASWQAVYPRILQLSEERLLRPMWWPAGA